MHNNIVLMNNFALHRVRSVIEGEDRDVEIGLLLDYH